MTKKNSRSRRAKAKNLTPAVLALSILVTFSSSGLLLARVLQDGVERPGRMTEEERDRLSRENEVREAVGGRASEICAAIEESGEKCDFQTILDQQIRNISGAADLYAEEGEESEELVCLDDNGEFTNVRSECAANQTEVQSEYFGLGSDEDEFGEYEDVGGDDFDGFYVSDENMGGYMNDQFQGQSGPMMGGMNLAAVIDEALSRLESGLQMVKSDRDLTEEIQEGIEWLEEIRGDLAAGDIAPEEHGQYAEEIFNQLQPLQEMMSQFGGQFAAQSMEGVLAMMETMMNDILPWIIQLFKDEGLPVSARAMAAYEEARAAYNKNAPSCRNGNMSACSKLGDIMGGLEAKMKPDMEAAIMDSDNPELMQTIEARMQDVMGDMMGPPADMGRGMMDHYGPPLGYEDMMQGGYGMPPGFDPRQFQGGYGQYGY